MLLQTNSYIVPKEKRSEHARLMRRFKQVLGKLGCDMFEIYEQVGANWNGGDTSGRYVQIMRFRDRKHQVAVQNAERSDPAAQALIAEFCELVNFQYQQQQGFFAVGFYNSVLPSATTRVQAAEPEEADEASAAGAAATSFSDSEMVEPAGAVASEAEAEAEVGGAGPGADMVEGELVSEGDASHAISNVEPMADKDHAISALEPAELESTEDVVEESAEFPEEEAAVEESVAEASPETDAGLTDVEEIDGEAGGFESESIEPEQITSESAPLEVVESMESEEHEPVGEELKSLEEEHLAEPVTEQHAHAADASAGDEPATDTDEYHFGDNGEEEHKEEHAVAEHSAEHPEVEVPEQNEQTVEEHHDEEHTEVVGDAPVEETAEVVEEHTESNGEHAEVEQPQEPSAEVSEPAPPPRRSLFRRRGA
jgi:hypothetical protein